jgi:hypothetical protein
VVWTFDGPVLMVFSDIGGTGEASTNALLGLPTTTYPGAFANRGLETNDGFMVSGNTLSVWMQVTEPGDWIRVVTRGECGVPDSGQTLGLFGLALAGLAAACRKFARA